jgi:protein O-GlcNAc transferase
MATIKEAINLLNQGRLSEAEAKCRSILAGEPQHFEALYHLGSIKLQSKDLLEARAHFEKAISVKPDSVEALSALAFVLFTMSLFDEALAMSDQALVIAPSNSVAWVTRGNALHRSDRLEDALASYDKALDLSSNNIEALIARGTVLVALGRPDEAVANFDRILPGPNWINLLRRANLLLSLGLFAAAKRDFQRWIEMSSDPLPGWVGLARCASESCDWPGLVEPRQKVLAALDTGQPVAPFVVLQLSGDPAQQLRGARIFAPQMALAAPLPARAKPRPDRLRLAYISPDFRIHPLAYLIAELLERHDRNRFETIGVSLGPQDGSDIRARIVVAFDQFHDMQTRSDNDIVALLRNLNVDIAIDLAGYTLHSRPSIFAHRVAPIQASYLGFCGTSGSNFIDYLLVDRVAVPPEQQRFFSEKLVYLPDSFMVTDSTQPISDAPQSRAQYGLPDEGFVFCCFNKNYKITQQVFDVWMRLLRAVEGSVLWLSANLDRGQENLRRYAQGQGVSPQRIVFAPGVSRAEHFARHRLADLFLDTLPYNAHTSANDALFAGLPLLTVLGTTFVGRVAASMLYAIGLDELVTRDLEEYEALALTLARDPVHLHAVRAKLATNRQTQPLFQIDRFRRNIEKVYDEMFGIYRRGEPPRHFDVAGE